MTSEISKVSSIFQWAYDNRKKLQSVYLSVAIYVAGLQGTAAVENGGAGADEWKHFWDILIAQPLTVIPMVIGAAVAGWRTHSDKTPRQQRKAEKKTAAKLDEYRQLKELDENGG